MLTRRQAKLNGEVLPSLWEDCRGCDSKSNFGPKKVINDLSDLSLVHIFSFLSLSERLQAAQVCSRWRDLCSLRCLWASQRLTYSDHDRADTMKLIRMLRRSVVPPYTALVIKSVKWSYIVPRSREVYFEKNASRLVLPTSSPFVALLALQELLTDSVVELELCDTCDLGFSEFEAFTLWNTIASNNNISRLTLELTRTSALFNTPFRFPADPDKWLSTFEFRLAGVEGGVNGLCLPVRSLLQAHQDTLTRVHIHPQDQQALLQTCPRLTRGLSDVLARPVPGVLAKVLRSADSLRTLRLTATTSGPLDRVQREALLVVRLPRLAATVEYVNLQLKREATLDILLALGSYSQLRYLTLVGFSSHLDELPSVLKRLPLLLEVHLDALPASAVLEALTPAVVPALRFLTFRGSCCGLAECRFPAVRRLLHRLDALHVRFERVGLSEQCESVHGNLPRTAVLAPHPLAAYCKNCPATRKKTWQAVYIGDWKQ